MNKKEFFSGEVKFDLASSKRGMSSNAHGSKFLSVDVFWSHDNIRQPFIKYAVTNGL